MCGPVDTGPRLSKTKIKLDYIIFEGHSKVINIPRVTQKPNFEKYFRTSKTDFETRVVMKIRLLSAFRIEYVSYSEYSMLNIQS